MNKAGLRIALLGTRGIPGRYGGFETCAQEISDRLVQKGHQVTVYCRSRLYPEMPGEFHGIKLVYLPSLPAKALETISHTFFAAVHAALSKYDVILAFNTANSPLLLPLRLLGKKVLLNTDGLEWRRTKWGRLGRLYLKFCEKTATLAAGRLITDSRAMQLYYRLAHRAASTRIAYGADLETSSQPELLEKYGLQPGSYFLQITRFEPENNPLLSLRAFNRLAPSGIKLVLVGNCRYPSHYLKSIHREAGNNVVLTGFVYDQAILRELRCNCLAYLHGNQVGGTNPALLQAMASGAFVLARDVVFNREVLKDCGRYFKPDQDDLAAALQWVLENRSDLDHYRRLARQRIRAHYNWEQVSQAYEDAFNQILEKNKPRETR